MTTNPTALDLLKRAEGLLSALHGSVARHDNLAANYACAGCELRDQISAALPSLAVVPAAVPPTTQTALREQIADVAVPFFMNFSDEEAAKVNARELADALAVLLPPTTDRTALERVRAVLETEAVVGRSALEYRGLITSALMADEAQQQPDTQARPGCTCPHPDDEHSIYGCADGCGCEWMPKRTPVQHAPGTAALCPDCRVKDHSVCMDDDEPESPCTCGSAGDGFVPLGHYRDCPAAAAEPHPTEADLRHALAVAAKFHGQDTDRVEADVPIHAVPLPGSNGISACCGRPPCEFVGERVTRDPAAVTCRGAVVSQPGKEA